MTSPNRDHLPRRRTRPLVVIAVAVAGASLGVGGAFAAAAAQEDAQPRACRPTAADLMRAATQPACSRRNGRSSSSAAPRPADYDDLRLAASGRTACRCSTRANNRMGPRR